jgi:hypothetical protein
VSTKSKMHERIYFVHHLGKKILLIDFSNCPASEVEDVARRVPDYVTAEPRGSVLVLTNFTGALFDRDAIRAVKETAVFDKPYVKKSALLGVDDLPVSFYEELQSFSRRELLSFKNREEALAWLISSTDG